ncbi:sugar dehydrogenase complex small subunit [Paraburkholderia aromaticivorans]|uniref:sugar dehydrogenase complex small subunit n=1 Tax=Paraburkholderia aromaticivorans TaxID=2026199 RepID=UPI001455F137|nr:sugar dehydrogenase complex small subunit [Paraburkholderia aromaticivorans]
MDNTDTSFSENAVADPRRRLLLSGLLATCASLAVPFAMAQTPAQSRPQSLVGNIAAPASFLENSRILTGRSSLDAAQAARLYEALVSDDADFEGRQQQLLAFIKEQQVDPMQLQKLLDAQKSVLARVPRAIVTAWYTGIVGAGERAKCITFETNLLNVITAEKLKPPSYSYGVYGSWAAKPA